MKFRKNASKTNKGRERGGGEKERNKNKKRNKQTNKPTNNKQTSKQEPAK